MSKSLTSTGNQMEKESKIIPYKHIIDSTISIVAMVNRQFVYQYVNNAFVQAFEKKREKIIGSTVKELLGEEGYNRQKPFYDRCLNGERVNFQTWFELPGLGKCFMDIIYSPYIAADGKVSAVVISAHDISIVKRLQEKLQESEECFRLFAENIPADVYIKDEEDRHVFGNQKAIESAQVKPEHFIGKTTRDFWPEKLAEKLIRIDKEILAGNYSKTSIEWQHQEQGDKTWLQDIKFPITLQSGKKLLGGIAIDITAIKRNEEILQESLHKIKLLERELKRENRFLREQIEKKQENNLLVGESSAIIKIKADINRVAPLNTIVLITGETGTGKELVARSIHKNSKRSNQPFIQINCAALPASLIEAELFGREKGAYTGAMTRQVGRFELAKGGTLFMDEIGDLPIELQSKLLRVLQDGKFERLGGHQTIYSDARIISATNKELDKEVDAGRFRADLFYRLNVFQINVPPLVERKDDIPLLVWHFTQRLANEMGKRVNSIPKHSMEKLQNYNWPGNVRELKNVIERAIIVSKDESLEVESLKIEQSVASLGLSLEQVNRNHICRILEKTGWRVRGKGGAAEILAINPQTLDSRMKKLGIKRTINR